MVLGEGGNGLLHDEHPVSGPGLQKGQLRLVKLCNFFPKSLLGGVSKELVPLQSVRLMSAKATVRSLTVAATTAAFFFAIRKAISHFHKRAPYNCLLKLSV